MTKTATAIEQSETKQQSLTNNDFLNDNDIETNIEVIGLYLYTAGLVIVALMVILLLCVMWLGFKKKNCPKICHFLYQKVPIWRGHDGHT